MLKNSQRLVSISVLVILIVGFGLFALFSNLGAYSVSLQASNRNISFLGSNQSQTASNGLMLISTISDTKISSGALLHFNISVYSTLNTVNKIPVAHAWALLGLAQNIACPSRNVPFSYAVYNGSYSMANISSAISLPFWPSGGSFSCPAFSYTGFTFYPQSYVVTANGTIVSGPTSLSVNAQLNGYWNVASEKFISFPPAQYTLAVGDQWGGLILFEFTVNP